MLVCTTWKARPLSSEQFERMMGVRRAAVRRAEDELRTVIPLGGSHGLGTGAPASADGTAPSANGATVPTNGAGIGASVNGDALHR